MSTFNDDFETPKNRKKRILDELDNIDSDEVFLTSSIKSSKKKNKVEDEEETDDLKSWVTTLNDLAVTEIKPSRQKLENIFGQKKKKKKKEGKDEIDYAKEFEPESQLLNNLLVEQSRFVNSLQKKFDQMDSMKTANRGTSKMMTDFIANVTSARQLSSQLVDKKIALKKTIAELELKRKKEMAGQLDGEDLNDFASQYLKNIISNQGNSILREGGNEIRDIDNEDDFFDIIDDNVVDERGSDVANYLKYENRNVKIVVLLNPHDDNDYDFIALAEDGEVIPDYPLPEKTSLSINRSIMIATDTYGKKYHIEYKGE